MGVIEAQHVRREKGEKTQKNESLTRLSRTDHRGPYECYIIAADADSLFDYRFKQVDYVDYPSVLRKFSSAQKISP